ncbi:MAG: class I SAM-dependent methyltransferase [Bacteriovoracaceae bacterium]|nr:class I SAM-dependent methyltransferase [Bacteriovoracaceae bacterium]
MDLAPYYDEAYTKFLRQPMTQEMSQKIEKESRGLLQLVDEIKEKFFANVSWESLKVVELGGGMGGISMQLARRGAKVTLVDFAPHALEVSTRLSQSQGLEIKTELLDLGRPDARLDGQFDLMIDSHLFHCLPLTPQRISYLHFVREHLSDHGYLVGETMVHRKKLFIPDGYMLDQENILWQMFGEWVPVRKIIDSLDLEEEFKKAGLNISYFFYYANYAFAPSADFWDIPAEVLPASVRFAVKKA